MTNKLTPFAQTTTQPIPARDLSADLSLRDPTGMFSNWGGNPFNPDLLIQQKTLKIYDDIRLDDQARAALSFKKLAVTAPGWTIQPPEGAEDDDEITDFVRTQLEELPGTVEHTLHQILSAMDYGYSITEKVFAEKEGRLALAGLKPKYPHGFDFDVDLYGNLKPDGLVQGQYGSIDGSKIKRLPIAKFVIYSYQMEFSNPYGNSDLRTAYRPWWTKDNAYKWMAMLLEKFGIPPIFALYNSQVYKGGGIASEIQNLVNKIRVGTGASVPRNEPTDLEFWSPELTKNLANTFIPAINLYDKHIARAILLPSLIGMTADQEVGSLARSNTHFDSFLLVIGNAQADLEAAINEQLIRSIVDLNFANAEYPKFKFNPLTDEIKSELADAWATLVNANVVKRGPADEDHFREIYKMPPAPEDADVIPGPTPPPLPGQGQPPGSQEAPEPPEEEPEEVAEQRQAILSADPGDVRSFAIPAEPRRELTMAEEAADVLRLFAVIEEGEEEARDELSSVFRSAKQRTLRWLDGESELRPELAEQYQHIPNLNSLRGTVQDMLSSALEDGERSAGEEISKQADFKADFTPEEALSYLDSKSITVAQATDQAIVSQVKQALLNGVATGQSIEQVKSRISEVFDEYDGISGHRAEVIVRTNYNDAFNQGRLQSISRAGDFVQAVQYSAIIDGRETDVCRSLDGKIFELGSPELDRLTPPRHHQCRSLWVPVMIGRDIDQADRIDQSQADEAIRLSGKGF